MNAEIYEKNIDIEIKKIHIRSLVHAENFLLNFNFRNFVDRRFSADLSKFSFHGFDDAEGLERSRHGS